MKTLVYNKNGLGITELMYLALNHAVIFSIVNFLIIHNVKVLPVIRLLLKGGK